MQMVRKIFSLGLLLAALGLLVSSCVEPKDTYSVTVSGSGAVSDNGSGTEYEAGDVVTIKAGTKADSVFWMWTSDTVSNVTFDNPTSPTTTFIMPAMNVAVKAWWKPKDVEVEYYTAYIFNDGEDQENVFVEEYEAGDTVKITAVGSFLMWAATDTNGAFINVNFGNAFARSTFFIMPAKDVYVFVVPEVDIEPEASVRYTWEAVEQPNIIAISASYDDVLYWFEEVYSAADYVEEDATAIPLYDGSHEIPDNIYSRTIGSTEYKGVYLPISEGQYTAVCSVIDTLFFKVDTASGDTLYNIADIVANYDIEIGADEKSYFEIAFDVGTFLAGEDDLGWFGEKYDNPVTGPSLEKAKVKKLVKKVKKGKVTYYVLHRLGKRK